MKTCTKCGKEKPEIEFRKSKKRKDGLQVWCKECVCGYSREYYQKNRIKLLENQRKWRERNPEKAKQMGKEAMKRLLLKRKTSAYDLLGNKCNYCGISDIRVLQIDHIEGNGIKDRKTKKGYITSQTIIYKKVLENPEKFQLLCANCNWIKRWEREEWRHK